MNLYHYTLGIKLDSIYKSGVIRTSPKRPVPPELPICWLSSNENYEFTALKSGQTDNKEMFLLNLEEMVYWGQGIFRFVFDHDYLNAAGYQIYQWPELSVKCKAEKVIIDRLETRARFAHANSSDWFGTVDQELPIVRARLQKGTLVSLGKVEWHDVNPFTLEPVSSNVKQCTVAELGNTGQCTDEMWASHSK